MGQPSGTVTFLFTDIEGSTARWERAPDAMRVALARHDDLLRAAIAARGGYVFKTVGDAFCAAFGNPSDAVGAALAAQRALDAEAWPEELGELRVRMALQTGAAELRDGDYFGRPLNRVARLLSAGHGGQVLLALPTAELVRDALPDGAALRDLGEHRLKDLARPERVFQLDHPALRADFPPLRSLDARPHNLPAQPSPLVGREEVVAEVLGRLLLPATRLLTLLGPGGIGKTRLGLQVAAEALEHFEDGAYVVQLASVADPTLVAPAIAEALGVPDSGGRRLLDALTERLRDRRLLLLLDNFEQVVPAAADVAALLSACPRLVALVTSRAALRVSGEQAFPIPALGLPEPAPTPTPDDLARCEAPRLFILRAQAVRPDFRVTEENAPAVAEICRRLDGLPLAIELAAARVRLLPPEAMLARLGRRLHLLTSGARDLPARQQTLRGAIDWSHDLLDGHERRLFRRLSVFAGGCTLEAAEAVAAGAEADGMDAPLAGAPDAPFVLDTLEALVEKSLVRRDDDPGGEPRFVMLETIREYAADQLDAAGEADAVRRRHAAWVLALAEEAEPRLKTTEQVAWLGRLEREHANLRAALGTLLGAGDGEAAQRLAASARLYWWFGGHVGEGREALARALAASEARTGARAKALLGLGIMAWLQNDYAEARAALEESRAIARELGDAQAEASALTHLGQATALLGDADAALPMFEAAAAVFRRADDRWGLGLLALYHGNALFRRGDFEGARAHCERALGLFRQVGGDVSLTMPLNILGALAMQRGDYPTARAFLEEALSIRRALRDTWECGHLLNTLGDAARMQERHDEARRRYEESLACMRVAGSREGVASVLHNLGRVAAAEGRAADAVELFRDALGRFRDLDDPRGVAECLAGLGGALVAAGVPEEGARLLGACDGILDRLGAALWYTNRPAYERSVADAVARLGPGGFEAARAAGRALGLDEAVAAGMAARLAPR